ncbi:MAG: dynamin family protein [Gemmatales bacterium]|nr:dynamin family protein [Gemmatales bacterium]
MNLHEIKINAEQTADAWDRLAALLAAEPGLDNLRNRLSDRAAKLRANRFTILVVGEFKRGKSTLLNALLGKRVLPQKAAPCTAVVTVIRYGDPPRVDVVFQDGRIETLTTEEFMRKYELKVDDTAYDSANAQHMEEYEAKLEQQLVDRFGGIREAVLSYPLELCRDNVEFVDSPGLGEHPARERRVLEFLGEGGADAIIMVLSATQLLNERELRFITNTLTPLGKRRNLFFLINRWNQILDGLVDPSDPEEVRREFAEQEKLIEARLKPLCRVDGVDYSENRIFRVNALGALQQRLSQRPDEVKLRETNIPAFEEALVRFLSEERHRARQLSDGTLARETRASIMKFVQAQKTNLSQPLEELERKNTELQPKLQMLRDMAKQIDNYLTAKASEISQHLCESFDAYVAEHVEPLLPDMVEKLDLGRADRIFMSIDAALDLFRPEGQKFRDIISAHLQPQIARFFKPKVLAWGEGYARTILNGMAVEVQRQLQKDAGKYLGVLGEIEQQIGQPGQELTAQEQLHKWLSEFLTRQSGINVGIKELGLDLAPVMGSIILDVLAHMTLNFLPGIGFLISGILILLRGQRIREKIRGQVLQGICSKMSEFKLSQHEAIRTSLREQFAKLRDRIVNNINSDIALIDGTLQTLVAEKKRHRSSAEPRFKQLDAMVTAAEAELKRIEQLLK